MLWVGFGCSVHTHTRTTENSLRESALAITRVPGLYSGCRLWRPDLLSHLPAPARFWSLRCGVILLEWESADPLAQTSPPLWSRYAPQETRFMLRLGMTLFLFQESLQLGSEEPYTLLILNIIFEAWHCFCPRSEVLLGYDGLTLSPLCHRLPLGPVLQPLFSCV